MFLVQFFWRGSACRCKLFCRVRRTYDISKFVERGYCDDDFQIINNHKWYRLRQSGGHFNSFPCNDSPKFRPMRDLKYLAAETIAWSVLSDKVKLLDEYAFLINKRIGNILPRVLLNKVLTMYDNLVMSSLFDSHDGYIMKRVDGSIKIKTSRTGLKRVRIIKERFPIYKVIPRFIRCNTDDSTDDHTKTINIVHSFYAYQLIRLKYRYC